MPERTYDDDMLREAVAAAHSWRGVLRQLGLAATSSAAIRSVRRRVEALGLDHTHFTGQRRWSDPQLAEAVAASRSWTQVADRLGLAIGASTTALKGHATRLQLDTAHLNPRHRPGRDDLPTPDLALLPRAGSLLAASWFVMSGFEVSWPLEPCRYDLLAERDGQVWRVQVKTTRMRVGDSWLVRVLSGGRERGPYDPDDIDRLFVVDGDLGHYLIPVAAVAGKQGLTLASYEQYRVARDPMTHESASRP